MQDILNNTAMKIVVSIQSDIFLFDLTGYFEKE